MGDEGAVSPDGRASLDHPYRPGRVRGGRRGGGSGLAPDPGRRGLAPDYLAPARELVAVGGRSSVASSLISAAGLDRLWSDFRWVVDGTDH